MKCSNCELMHCFSFVCVAFPTFSVSVIAVAHKANVCASLYCCFSHSESNSRNALPVDLLAMLVNIII